MKTETLERKVRTNQSEIGITNCGYCAKEISKSTAYKSPNGDYYYCNKHCFDMFTED